MSAEGGGGCRNEGLVFKKMNKRPIIVMGSNAQGHTNPFSFFLPPFFSSSVLCFASLLETLEQAALNDKAAATERYAMRCDAGTRSMQHLTCCLPGGNTTPFA